LFNGQPPFVNISAHEKNAGSQIGYSEYLVAWADEVFGSFPDGGLYRITRSNIAGGVQSLQDHPTSMTITPQISEGYTYDIQRRLGDPFPQTFGFADIEGIGVQDGKLDLFGSVSISSGSHTFGHIGVDSPVANGGPNGVTKRVILLRTLNFTNDIVNP